MRLLNRLGLFTQKDLQAVEAKLLRHAVHVARITEHAFSVGYVPPSSVAPYKNHRYHLDGLKATIKMRAPSMAKVMGL